MTHVRHRHRIASGTAAAAVLVAAAVLFQPWKLVVDEVVDEALPIATQAPSSPTASPAASPAASRPPDPTASPTASPAPSAVTAPQPAAPVELARGSFRSYEHPTSGTARVIRLADGQTIVRLQDLSTSNGPDVHVWLSPAQVGDDPSGLATGHLDLGVIKGNKGNANYPVPDGIDPTKYTSVALWCERFSVAFAAAALN